jgi:hypothetical protein
MQAKVEAAGGSAIAAVGVLSSMANGGVGFLTEPITVPFWFIVAAIVIPTGEMLAALRKQIPGWPGRTRDDTNDGSDD